MNETTITKKICVPSKHLNINIREYLADIAKEYAGKCDKEIGYIIHVEEDIIIIDNTISKACEGTNFTVQFKVCYLKPEVNQTYEGVVEMVYERGILLLVKNKIKVIVPLNALSDWEYDKEENVYRKNGEKKKRIKLGKSLKIIITQVEFAKGTFQCMGKLEGT